MSRTNSELVPFMVRIPAHEQEALKRLAKTNERSISAEIRLAIRDRISRAREVK